VTVRPLHDRIIGQRIDEGEQNVQVLGEQIRGHRRLDVRGDRRPAAYRWTILWTGAWTASQRGLLQPPRERLLTETGLERQLSGADRIVPGQPFEHFLFVGHGEWSGHVVVAFSPLASKS
jgi:hypothetical protein